VILVDTSVWVDHLRGTERNLAGALNAGLVLMHPFVLGELACGNLGNRRKVLRLLGALPSAPVATDDEALLYIERHSLMGRGIGWVDVHLLAAAALAESTTLWTRDARLRGVATDLSLSWPAS
jgi:predicted nucleic acid-binding protein